MKKNLIISLSMPFLVYAWMLLFLGMVCLTSNMKFYDYAGSGGFWLIYCILLVMSYFVRELLKADMRRQRANATWERRHY